MFRDEIARLERELERLNAERETCASEQTAQPGRDAFTLRENWIAEENRRSGLQGIDQAIEGVKRSLRMYREIAVGK